MFRSVPVRPGKRFPHPRRRRTTRSLQVEALEDRLLLSAYRFEPLAFLGDPAPGGGTFVHDFELGAANKHGEVIFAADIDAAGDEGIFLARPGRVTQPGCPARCPRRGRLRKTNAAQPCRGKHSGLRPAQQAAA
jgi:hypothetical protein